MKRAIIGATLFGLGVTLGSQYVGTAAPRCSPEQYQVSASFLPEPICLDEDSNELIYSPATDTYHIDSTTAEACAHRLNILFDTENGPTERLTEFDICTGGTYLP